ncbi:SDR family NAD(P)-dependent oxidoreductase [Mesorhizobium sp. Z1-4]|uniref:SDR family NAD(P)-dependent oxidoreductase n=1 Tax=Mesorhizobium sp. Z1-4 TaxID=2448478 RepID=UPI0013DF4E03|nr:SDR family NAD(P)-dependent oxidoreductase [Mesorhizobium sp. Z1-4]
MAQITGRRPRALATGGSEGLGGAFVELLLASGYDVVSVDRNAPPAASMAVGIICDLADRVALDRNLDAIVAAGPYRLVLFNAGVSATGRFEAVPLEAYRRLVAVNTEAPMVLASALVNADAVNGHLCFVSSLSHFTGYPGAAVYAASKDALAAYAKSVRKPFAQRGVSVTVAYPGPLRTAHAARHAPPGASVERRTDPAAAARHIVGAALAGRAAVYSDARARMLALAGRLMPDLTIRAMRRVIFDRLDRDVW